MIDRMGVMPLPPAMPRWWRCARRLDGHEEAALRRHHVDGVAGLEVLVDPVGEHAAAHLAHADAQLAVVDAGADRIGAAQVLPAISLRSVRYWPWVKPNTGRRSSGTSKETITASEVSGCTARTRRGWKITLIAA
jgi:hypothetical protein